MESPMETASSTATSENPPPLNGEEGSPSPPLAQTDAEILAALQARHGTSTKAPNEDSVSTPNDYPGVHEVECVCTYPNCGVDFSVPMWFNAPHRPVGVAPKLCARHRAEQDEIQEERIRREEAEVNPKRDPEREVLAAMEKAGGNPFAFGLWTLDNFPARPWQEKALTAAREWTTAVLDARDRYDKVRGLYLVGPTGTAKSQILHCVMRALLEAGMKPGTDVIFDDSLSLIERIQGTYGSDDSTWALLESRIAARVWVLDDFMAEKPSDDVIRKLTLILNRREGKPTGVTSNYMPTELRDRHREAFRMLSRFGTAQFRIVKVEGDDMRFTPAA